MKEINIFGIYIAPFALYFFIALVLYIILRRKCFDRWEVERWFWHRHLFDFAVFVIILALVGLVF
jgi:hypothetical protein